MEHSRTRERALSPTQERLWFIDQFVRVPATTIARRFRLRGVIIRRALEVAVKESVDTFSAIRLTIDSQEGRPIATAGGEPLLTFVDLRGLTLGEARQRAREHSQAEAQRAFQLATGPLARISLITVANDEHLLCVTAHRAALDHTGISLLVNGIAASYRRVARDGVVPSSMLPTPVGSATTALPEVFSSPAADDEVVASWADHLRDVATLELPTDRSRPPHGSYDAACAEQVIPATTVAALRDLADRAGATIDIVALAGLHALLHRYTGHEVIAVGTSVAAERIDRTVVVRTACDAKTTFVDLVGQVGEALKRPDCPFEQLVAAINPPRDPSRSPVFQVTAAANVDLRPDFGSAARLCEARPVSSGATLFDLDVLFDLSTLPDEHTGSAVTAIYRTDLFDPHTAQRMLSHLCNLLAQAANAVPETAVASLPLLDPRERAQVVEEFNQTDVPYPKDATVQELFEEQVLRTPDHRAVTFEGAHLTYRQLSTASNQIAHYLRAQGVGRGTLVGIALERSLDFLPVMLGVLKSGGAYVPLDPAYPTERLAFMLVDTQATVLVSQEKLLDILPDSAAQLIVLEQARSDIASRGTDDPGVVNTAEDLTYIVYTSGSTGRPKGVRTIHRGVARLSINTDILVFDEQTSYLQISPLSFDACTLEIFGPLLNGGRVVLMPPGVPTPARVAQTVREQGVDTLWLVSPLANLTIDAHLHELAGLRQFMVGGDVLSLPHMRKVREALPHVSLVNGYGPTEVTAFSVSYKLDEIGDDWPSVPIGRPMHNTTAYILDELGEPVPIGVWGELYLGGPGVAVGYHNRPELNVERFLPDKFRPAPDALLYRTGDRVRWLPDGNIQFHGRFDTQVKVDGLRVELGEVQSVIAADPAIGSAVVTAPEIAGRRKLVAYVIPAEGKPFDAQALRGRLANLLPSVMVPAHYVELEKLPLTPNNKVDLRALPLPDTASLTEYRQPNTHTQAALAEIWQEILGVPRVGLDDNFFQLGGHSLRAVPVIAAISARFGVDLGVPDIFEAPVLVDLANRIEDYMLQAIPEEEMTALLSEIA